MRQTHVGGDKLFVDYAGDTVPVIVDRLTGEVRQAQIFVAVMGASSFSYVRSRRGRSSRRCGRPSVSWVRARLRSKGSGSPLLCSGYSGQKQQL
jgi:transposase